MAALPWVTYLERVVGKNHPSLADVANRVLRQLFTESGYNPDADPFPGLMGPVFNVKAYGATGNGSTNDTVALQAAMDAANAAGGGVVYVPPGTYRYDTLKIYSKITLQGAGVAAGGTSVSQLYQPTFAGPLLQPNDPSVTTRGFIIRDLIFSAFGNTNNTGGLDLTGCSLFDLDRVHVSGARVYGIRVIGIAPVGNSGFGNFTRVHLASLQSGCVAWLFGSNTTLDQPDGLSFVSCMTNVAGDVVVIRSTGPIGGHGPGSHAWVGCRFELGNSGGPQVLVDCDAQGYGAEFVACRFETFGIAATLNLVGVAYSGGISFHRTTIATSGGALTINDTGAVPTQWFGMGTGIGGIGRYGTILPNVAVGVQSVSTNTTLNGFTAVTLVDATSGPITISLPDPTVLPAYSVCFRVMKKDSSANAVTISAGARTLNGVTTKLLHRQYQCLDIMSDGANWFTVAAHGISALGSGGFEMPPFSALRWGVGDTGEGYFQIDGTPKAILSLNNTTRYHWTGGDFSPVVSGGASLGDTQPFSRLGLTQYAELAEIADPSAPAADKGRFYIRDNGAGKSQLVVRFPTGAVQVIATEP